MNETTQDVIAVVRSGWPQILAIFAVIWWARKIDLRSQEQGRRLDRHEARLTAFEHAQQAQAIHLARIEEALNGMKLTLDRIYTELREKTYRPDRPHRSQIRWMVSGRRVTARNMSDSGGWDHQCSLSVLMMQWLRALFVPGSV